MDGWLCISEINEGISTMLCRRIFPHVAESLAIFEGQTLGFASEFTNNCLSIDEFASELNDCLSVNKFHELTDCLSVNKFHSELNYCLSVDEFAIRRWVEDGLSFDDVLATATRTQPQHSASWPPPLPPPLHDNH
jgi:hypothetical protein